MAAERESDSVDNRIRENLAFIDLLEEKSDPSFESFTPRQIRSSNKGKIKELREEQRNLLEASGDLKQKVTDLDEKIAELNSVIRVAREVEKPSDELITEASDNEILRRKLLETQEAERQRIARDLHDSTVQSLTGLVHKAELCYKLMELDPNRCKVELKSLSSHTKEIINDMRALIYDLRPMSFDDIGDGMIYFSGACRPGDFAQVRITGMMDGELLGEEVARI